VHSLTLESHESNLTNVIQTMQDLFLLNEEIMMKINDEEKLICAFVLTFIEDTSQQQFNSDFMSHNANRECRSCLVSKVERTDLKYDIIVKNCYHHRVLQERAKTNRIIVITRRVKTFQFLKMKTEQSLLMMMTSALNIIRTRSTDSAHFKFARLAKQSQSLLFSAILTSKRQSEYTLQLQKFPFSST